MIYSELKPSGIAWLGDVPKQWKIVRLKDVCDDIVGGGTPKTNVAEYWENGEIHWLSPTDFQDFEQSNFINKSRVKISKLGYESCSAKLLPIGTVIMTSRASIGLAKMSSEIVCTNQGFMNFICSNKLYNRFLFYVINADVGHKFQNIATGTTFLEISRKTVKQEKIALPSLKEQTAIVHFLDTATAELDKALRLKKKQLDQLDTYRKALIHEAVTKGLDKNAPLSKSGVEWLGNVPKHWKIVRLKDICDDILSGGTPKTNVSEYWEEGDILWLSPTDFQDFEHSDFINSSRIKINKLGYDSCSAKLLPLGTVIMTSRASIGLAKISSEILCTNQGFMNFICSRRLNNKFLLYVINSDLGHKFLNVATGTTFLEISRRTVKQEKIALPLIQEQEAIVTYLDEKTAQIATAKTNIAAQITALETYRKSLIHECVTGKRRLSMA